MTLIVNSPPSQYRSTWLGWGLSLLLHGLPVSMFYWKEPVVVPPVSMPPAIMLQWAERIEVSVSNTISPLGLTQVSAQAAEEKVIYEEPDLHVLHPKITDIQKAELVVRKRKNKPTKKDKQQLKKKHKGQRNEESQNSVANQASPKAQEHISKRIAAPFDSNGLMKQTHASWESLVLGHLNRFKRYPQDARERQRTGTVTIRFTLDSNGYIKGSQVIVKSGTRSLDREALMVLSRAQPLPRPPANILRNGEHIVTLPLVFSLQDLRKD